MWLIINYLKMLIIFFHQGTVSTVFSVGFVFDVFPTTSMVSGSGEALVVNEYLPAFFGDVRVAVSLFPSFVRDISLPRNVALFVLFVGTREMVNVVFGVTLIVWMIGSCLLPVRYEVTGRVVFVWKLSAFVLVGKPLAYTLKIPGVLSVFVGTLTGLF